MSNPNKQVLQNIAADLKAAASQIENLANASVIAPSKTVATFYYPEHGNGALIKRDVVVVSACDKYIVGTEQTNVVSHTKLLPVVKKFLKSKVIGLDITVS